MTGWMDGWMDGWKEGGKEERRTKAGKREVEKILNTYLSSPKHTFMVSLGMAVCS